MKFYAHRGNLDGRIAERENQPEYIDEAIQQGFGVEVDLWKVGDRIYLGHDEGQYDIDEKWLLSRSFFLLIHAKNREAFDYCLKRSFHTFWHTDEDYVMTSWGLTVGYPGKLSVGDRFLLAVPERHWENVEDCKPFITYGVLSDYVKTLNTR
jgi:hypothetical protein